MNSGGRSGIGFLGALALVFIVLKLTGVVLWSWFWVLSPIWIPAGLGAGLLLAWALTAWMADWFDDRAARVRRERLQRASAGRPGPDQHGPRQRWGARPAPVYGNCPRHDTVHEMLKYGRMCDGWEPADPTPPDLTS